MLSGTYHLVVRYYALIKIKIFSMFYLMWGVHTVKRICIDAKIKLGIDCLQKK